MSARKRRTPVVDANRVLPTGVSGPGRLVWHVAPSKVTGDDGTVESIWVRGDVTVIGREYGPWAVILCKTAVPDTGTHFGWTPDATTLLVADERIVTFVSVKAVPE